MYSFFLVWEVGYHEVRLRLREHLGLLRCTNIYCYIANIRHDLDIQRSLYATNLESVCKLTPIWASPIMPLNILESHGIPPYLAFPPPCSVSAARHAAHAAMR